jgi:hypothetical protein
MNEDVLAWKDEDYREAMGADLSTHPAGQIDLSHIGTDAVGASSCSLITISYMINSCANLCELPIHAV